MSGTMTVSFPDSDAGLLAWSANFLELITATPTAFGLVAGDATSYQIVHDSYASALAACDPAQRNKAATVAKNQARTDLKAKATLLANKVYSTSTVSDSQKVELGIPPRATPTSVPVPASAPVLAVLMVMAWTARIRLSAAGGVSRGKLPGTAGASIFSYVGATPPSDIASWKFEGSCGRVTKIDVNFDNSLEPGTKVWLTAFWFNGRKQSGPACAPVGVNLPGGGVSMAA
jgi:hypothetical protein